MDSVQWVQTKDHIEEIDFQEPFFIVVNWPISEFYGAAVCIMHYSDQSATNQLANVFLMRGVGFCKRAVPGLNPASLQPAGTCHSLLGSQQGWHDNCRLASEGRHKQKTTKIHKKRKKVANIHEKEYLYPRYILLVEGMAQCSMWNERSQVSDTSGAEVTFAYMYI